MVEIRFALGAETCEYSKILEEKLYTMDGQNGTCRSTSKAYHLWRKCSAVVCLQADSVEVSTQRKIMKPQLGLRSAFVCQLQGS